MSRRQRTMLTLSVRVPLPAGHTQKALVEWLQSILRKEGGPFANFETQVRITGRETTYL